MIYLIHARTQISKKKFTAGSFRSKLKINTEYHKKKCFMCVLVEIPLLNLWMENILNPICKWRCYAQNTKQAWDATSPGQWYKKSIRFSRNDRTTSINGVFGSVQSALIDQTVYVIFKIHWKIMNRFRSNMVTSIFLKKHVFLRYDTRFTRDFFKIFGYILKIYRRYVVDQTFLYKT